MRGGAGAVGARGADGTFAGRGASDIDSSSPMTIAAIMTSAVTTSLHVADEASRTSLTSPKSKVKEPWLVPSRSSIRTSSSIAGSSSVAAYTAGSCAFKRSNKLGAAGQPACIVCAIRTPTGRALAARADVEKARTATNASHSSSHDLFLVIRNRGEYPVTPYSVATTTWELGLPPIELRLTLHRGMVDAS